MSRVEPEAVGVHGNAHYEDADESQKRPCSCAEFTAEELVKQKGRSRKAEPSSLSLFDSALSLEQERESEPVDA